jgi:hypothetical protein
MTALLRKSVPADVFWAMKRLDPDQTGQHLTCSQIATQACCLVSDAASHLAYLQRHGHIILPAQDQTTQAATVWALPS